MIFAAGVGSRLKPWTDSHPKALAEVGGVPALGRLILQLKRQGVDRICVNVHHFAEQIVTYLEANQNFGLPITISDEREKLLDTGGGLLRALVRGYVNLDEPLLLHNVDVVTDQPIKELFDQHAETGTDTTLLCSERATSRHLYFDASGRLTGWRNDKTGETVPTELDSNGKAALAFDGLHIVNLQALLPRLKEYGERKSSSVFSLTPFYLETQRELDIRCVMREGCHCWFDIGTPQKLATANEFVFGKEGENV